MYLNPILTGITLTDRSSPTPRVARDAAHVTCSADVHLGTGHETYETFSICLGFVLILNVTIYHPYFELGLHFELAKSQVRRLWISAFIAQRSCELADGVHKTTNRETFVKGKTAL